MRLNSHSSTTKIGYLDYEAKCYPKIKEVSYARRMLTKGKKSALPTMRQDVTMKERERCQRTSFLFSSLISIASN